MKRLLFLSPALVLAAIVACTRTPAVVPSPPPPVVKVANPRVQSVTDYTDFTGRAKASDTVDIKARVTGYLNKIHFKDGVAVKAGDPLFEIEPGTYETDLNRAKAVVQQAEVTVTNRRRDYDRVFSVSTSTGQEKDKALADLDAAKADLDVARKQEAQARKLFDYTKIHSPMTGRISRRLVDQGSLVKADDTLLATVVATDPMYVYFDVDDRTHLMLKELKDSGLGTEVRIALPTQDGFPEPAQGGFVGVVDFNDTQLSATTGTISKRAVVPNPKGVLTPNLFVRVRLPVGLPRERTLVPEEAVGTDQGLKFVYVVNAEGVVEYRQVKLGLQVGTDVVVEPVPGRANSGVTPADQVIVEGQGLQRVRKGAKVTVKSGREPSSTPASRGP
ncbi:MAG: efflux RND transporter periplasmic adaptor subunit [Fimbriiglobus sp.]|jgi:RND family efflux transporter MFP subunit|nr:efflux RND transporter periplasmic adaptor subunit [Fimbriiglobus sp.]